MWDWALLIGFLVVGVIAFIGAIIGHYCSRPTEQRDGYCVGCDADLTGGAYAYYAGHPLCRDCADEIGVPATWYGNLEDHS